MSSSSQLQGAVALGIACNNMQIFALPSLILLLGSIVSLPTQGSPLPKAESERNCWLRHTAERVQVNLREPTSVEFSNLRSGYSVYSPFSVDFAVRGMGVVPAGQQHDKAGHHHILIDQRLPASITAPIPFNDKHRHFGKAQTGTLLELPAGKHTLRLLFADHQHKPHFVFSPEITVEVLGPRPAVTPALSANPTVAECQAWYESELTRPRPAGPWLDVVNLRSGETVSSPFNLRLGVGGFGVAAKEVTVEGTGHFVLEFASKTGKPVAAPDLSNGATQVNLYLPIGNYRLRVRFVTADGKRDLLPAQELDLVVAGQDRL